MGSLTSRASRASVMANSSEIQQFIKDAVAQEKVVVFSKSYCPYCKLAKDVWQMLAKLNRVLPLLPKIKNMNHAFQVFNKVKQPIKVYELDERDDGSAIQENLAHITGFRTVPQVFINGNCVGGGSDVKALLDAGKLQPMLIG